jgi:YegS/Rv2252/BmrU family lipid kinase
VTYYTCVIVNPASQNGATGKYWPELRSALDRVLGRWDHEFTLMPGDGTRLARQAVEQGYEMIVAVGGDGTMNEVATGLFDAQANGEDPRLIRDDLIIAAVRSGTGGDFARLFKLPYRVPACVAHLAGENTTACDLGWVQYRDHNGDQRGRAFLNIASFGLSGLVVDKVNQSSKMLGGKISFISGTIKGLLKYRRQGVHVLVDGEQFIKEEMVTVAVANGQFFGGGMHIAPEASIDDGLFDVVTQLRAGPREIIRTHELYQGRAIDWPSVRSTRGARIEAFPLDPKEKVLLDVDGEQPGGLPAVFQVFNGAVRWKR